MRFRKTTRVLFSIGVIAATTAAWGGCSPKKQTELVPGVSTQVRVPRDLKSIRMDVSVGGQPAFCQVYDVTNGVAHLPKTLALQSGTLQGPVLVTITGFKFGNGDGAVPQATSDAQQSCFQIPSVSPKVTFDGEHPEKGIARILRASRTPYVEGRVLFLPMPLKYSCFETSCGQDETCKGGACVPEDVDPASLLDYNDNLVFGTSSTCFSPALCMVDAVPPIEVDLATCKFVLPGTDGAPDGGPAYPFQTHGTGLNVRAVFDDGSVSEILDYDKDEGYTVPDPAKPQQFALAPGLCAALHPPLTKPPSHRIVALQASGLCPAKTAVQPICDEESPANPDSDAGNGGPPGGSDPGSSTCPVFEIKPAPSALVVLMDHSAHIQSLYGSGAAQSVLNLALTDPVFENLAAGLQFAPAPSNQCGNPGSYFGSTFEKEGKALLIQQEVAAILADTSRPFPSGPLQLDAALDPAGSYAALRALQAASGAPFNKLALLLLGNSDFTADCGATPLKDLAANARATGIDTYVLALGDTSATGLANGQAIGQSKFFDLTDSAGAGNALSTIQNDLATCLYNLPDTECGFNDQKQYKCTAGPDAQIDDDATISYFDPLGGKAAPIKRNPGCSASTQETADGWNLDGEHVRVCGKPCHDLQGALRNNAGLSALVHTPPPPLPIYVSNCAGGKPLLDGGTPPVVDSGTDAGAADAAKDSSAVDAGLDAAINDASSGG